jgi:hypothetical protein
LAIEDNGRALDYKWRDLEDKGRALEDKERV